MICAVYIEHGGWQLTGSLPTGFTSDWARRFGELYQHALLKEFMKRIPVRLGTTLVTWKLTIDIIIFNRYSVLYDCLYRCIVALYSVLFS